MRKLKSKRNIGKGVERRKTSDPHRLTLSWREIPSWMQDNEYILSGYRREQNSVLGCLYSIFGYHHNETINIHSHLWGAVLFAVLLFTLYGHLEQYPSVTFSDVAGFWIFLMSAIVCLTFSASYHTMTCHSKMIHDRLHAFDYVGIVVLTVGSTFPCIYYAFYCMPHVQIIYFTGLIIAGSSATYIVLSPVYAQPTYRGARTTVFVALGLFGVFPFAHAMYILGYRKLCDELGFLWVMASGALYLSGALFYVNRFPEKWFVQSTIRIFDKWFSSHQIFHFHVVLAALSHYFCLLKAVHHWHGVLGGVCLIT